MKRLDACLGVHLQHRFHTFLAFVAAAGILASSASSWSPSGDPEELEGRAPTAEELLPSVEAAFPEESYAAGTTARLVFFNAGSDVTLQLFHTGPETATTFRSSTGSPRPCATSISSAMPTSTASRACSSRAPTASSSSPVTTNT